MEKIEDEIRKLEKKISNPRFWKEEERIKTIQKLYSFKEKREEWEKTVSLYEEVFTLKELLEEEKDPEMEKEFKKKFSLLERKLNDLYIRSLLTDPEDKSNAILSIHPGAGGKDSCDWAQILLRMYKNWADSKGYRTRLVDWVPGEEAGIKSATLLVEGKFAYGYLREEIGIHRLIRISPFDASHRRHTSFAAVDVIPEIEEEKIDLKEEDLKIETFRAGGPGGQHVNVTDSAVRITHIPTGIVVQCQDQRSQHKNKAMALRILKSRLYNFKEMEKKKEMRKRYEEKARIEWGSQVRSYVFHPYKMVKDHRTQLETTDVESILNGEIDQFIITSLKQRQNKKEGSNGGDNG
ncbi:peptide chain release factor 2 [Candidatus Aerophobetes bacterium]|uniref:Peptide chain release factor 2 n=1 Tax=Aerophobetes bacterium TaxID=2030807 RepID=A0A662DCH7_UNCAE|nr:MAG: peptide chain release factor 2 [Candidatus Aerophobetes bacterium]